MTAASSEMLLPPKKARSFVFIIGARDAAVTNVAVGFIDATEHRKQAA